MIFIKFAVLYKLIYSFFEKHQKLEDLHIPWKFYKYTLGTSNPSQHGLTCFDLMEIQFKGIWGIKGKNLGGMVCVLKLLLVRNKGKKHTSDFDQTHRGG